MTAPRLELGGGRRLAVGLLALAAVLAAAAALSDPAGRLLAAPAALAALAAGLAELRAGPVLVADEEGLTVRAGLRRHRAPWPQVERLRVVTDRRAALLEVDLGATLVVLSRTRLGEPPAVTLDRLHRVRAGLEPDEPRAG